MGFWNKIQEDLKKNIQEGLEIFREGSSVVTEKLERLTVEGKNKYRVFNLNMKVQEEFTKLGGVIYDLVSEKSKNPLGHRNVKSILSRIQKLETQIDTLEAGEEGKPKKKASRKTTSKKTASKKTTSKKSVKKTSAKKALRKRTGAPGVKKPAERTDSPS